MKRGILADPVLHGMATGSLSDDDLAALGVNRGVKTDEMIARMIGSVREGVIRVAQEIDAIKAASDSGD